MWNKTAILSGPIFKCFIAFYNQLRDIFYSAPVWGMSQFFLLASRQVCSHKCSENTGCQNGLSCFNQPITKCWGRREHKSTSIVLLVIPALTASLGPVTDTLERSCFWFAIPSKLKFVCSECPQKNNLAGAVCSQCQHHEYYRFSTVTLHQPKAVSFHNSD